MKCFLTLWIQHCYYGICFSKFVQKHWQRDTVSQIIKMFFYYKDFLSRTLTIHKTAGKGRISSLFLFITSSCSRTFRHLFATLHVRLILRIYKSIACNNLTVTWWHLAPWEFEFDWSFIECWFQFLLDNFLTLDFNVFPLMRAPFALRLVETFWLVETFL